MSELFKLVRDHGIKAIAVVGMTKNVGKTVTFNYLVKEFENNGIVTGLVSAGYDGERFDRLTLKEKPRIYAPVGSHVATAEACFEASEAELELLERSTHSTPLGAVYLGRVCRAGKVELAGPGSVNGLRGLMAKMQGYGAGKLLVDGAINRLASASPAVTEATILATGASLGPTMSDVIRKTVFRAALLNIPAVNDKQLFAAAREGLQEGKAALIRFKGSACHAVPIKASLPLLAGTEMISRYSKDTAAFVFGGALVDKNLQDILQLSGEPPAVIVEDATRLFVSPEEYYRFINLGGRIMALNKLNLVAVTLNPTDPMGQDYDPHMFLEKMSESLKPYPVFDLMLEAG